MKTEKPNIVYIYADDLGRGMLSCYGQKEFKTPNIDSIANDGVLFTHYYGCAFCAPARASLISGIHDAHAGRWSLNRAGIYTGISHGEITYDEIRELINNTGIETQADDVFLGNIAQEAGYVTGQVGKLEWGFSTTPERIKRHGWDYHCGYYDHQRAHGFYPPFLFENGEIFNIKGNNMPNCGKVKMADGLYGENGVCSRKDRAVFSQDLFDDKIVEFIKQNKNRPFFLYHPSQIPHGTLTIPEIDPAVKDNPNLTDLEEGFASMVLRLDRTVGIILEQLERHGIAENTMIIFSADNGHCAYYPHREDAPRYREKPDRIDTKFYSDLHGDYFDGNSGLADAKGSNFEGGIRIPFLAKWPGHIKPRTTTNHYAANYDFLATVADLAGLETPKNQDGISFVPALLDKQEQQAQHESMIFASELGPAVITPDGWKLRAVFDRSKCYDYTQFGLFRGHITDNVRLQLFNMEMDIREETDVANENPDQVKKMLPLLMKGCEGNLANGTPQAHFAFYGDVDFDYRCYSY